MTQRERKIHGLVRDLRAVLDGKRTVTLVAGHGTVDISQIVVQDMVTFANNAAYEALQAVREAGGDQRACNDAASEAFVNAMPSLDNISNVRAFIACVAHGLKRGFLAAPQSRLLLYTAQLQLAAMTRRVQ